MVNKIVRINFLINISPDISKTKMFISEIIKAIDSDDSEYFEYLINKFKNESVVDKRLCEYILSNLNNFTDDDINNLMLISNVENIDVSPIEFDENDDIDFDDSEKESDEIEEDEEEEENEDENEIKGGNEDEEEEENEDENEIKGGKVPTLNKSKAKSFSKGNK